MKYVLLLRGINVGGHKKVPMAELRELFGKMGFENTKTLLNSGNVVFETSKTKEKILVEKLETRIEEKFGFPVPAMVRQHAEIQQLVELDPFQEIPVDKNIRLYVSFLPEKPVSTLQLPYSSPEQDFRILQQPGREVFSVLNLKNARSVDAMGFLEKEYGKNITTRNWNTVKKIAAV